MHPVLDGMDTNVEVKRLLENTFLELDSTVKLRSSCLTHHLLVLSQDQVVSAHGHTEDDGCDSLKAVDPLLPF